MGNENPYQPVPREPAAIAGRVSKSLRLIALAVVLVASNFGSFMGGYCFRLWEERNPTLLDPSKETQNDFLRRTKHLD